MSKAWVGATALMLSGCWQAASLGEPPPPPTTGGQSTAAITNTGGQTGSGSTGTTGGSTSAGTGTATTTGASLCGPCAPGALCVDGECRCQDGAICAGDSTNYCYAGTCEACERGSLFGDSCLVSLASQLNDPGCIAVDSQYVYWADNASVQRVLINGGPPQYIATIHSAGCLAIDSQNVYFTDQGSQTVQSAPLGGTGGSPPLAQNQNNPYGIAVDSNYVYWADHFGQSVQRALKLDGGDPTTLFSAAGADSGSTYPYAVAVDDHAVYWTNQGNGTVVSLPLNGRNSDGGAAIPTVLSAQHSIPYWLAVNRDAVYWTDNGGTGRVYRFVLDGGYDGGDCLADNQNGAAGIALDNANVYWTAPNTATKVLSLPLNPLPDAGTSATTGICGSGWPLPTVLAITTAPSQIAVDGNNAYWTSTQEPVKAVWQLTPK